MRPCIDYGRVGIALLASYGLAFGGIHWRDASAAAPYSTVFFLLFSVSGGGSSRPYDGMTRFRGKTYPVCTYYYLLNLSFVYQDRGWLPWAAV